MSDDSLKYERKDLSVLMGGRVVMTATAQIGRYTQQVEEIDFIVNSANKALNDYKLEKAVSEIEETFKCGS